MNGGDRRWRGSDRSQVKGSAAVHSGRRSEAMAIARRGMITGGGERLQMDGSDQSKDLRVR